MIVWPTIDEAIALLGLSLTADEFARAFQIAGPATVSFSGGRSSGLMLWCILVAHSGRLPDGVHVTFANTGKEREETLRFVHECASRWGVVVRWLEFVTDLRRVGASGRIEEVGYNSASRDGEPLSRLIARKQALFSTLSGRWCTERCKVGVQQDFMEAQGFPPGTYNAVIGYRSDEHDRVYELPRKPRNAGNRFTFPLALAGIRKVDVERWWDGQPFNLMLQKGTGNCDHCPFLSEKSRIARARLDPDGLDWWERHERARGFSFGYLSIAELRRHIATSPVLPMDEIDADAADAECGAWCAAA